MTFTGSTAAGCEIIKGSASNLARLTLELGGNDAGIVLPGTDPAAIAENLFWGAFITTEQTCAAMKRLYVHDSQYEEIIEAMRKVAISMPMGNGLDFDLEDAIARANGLDVGLGASVWSADPAAARKVAGRFEAGTVWINSHGGVHPMVPFGGVKSSGYGRNSESKASSRSPFPRSSKAEGCS